MELVDEVSHPVDQRAIWPVRAAKIHAWQYTAMMVAVCCDKVVPFLLKTVLIISQTDKSMKVPGGDAGHYG
ncbi:MAG: hypothetical protein QNL92_10635, partial [Octadecabacter sp.]